MALDGAKWQLQTRWDGVMSTQNTINTRPDSTTRTAYTHAGDYLSTHIC